MAIQATSVPSKRLAVSILSTDSSFVLNNILSWKGMVDGTTTLTAADFPTRAFGVFRNATNTQIEFFEFDPTTVASASITTVGRGLSYSGAYVDGATTKYNWNANETIVELGSHGPQEFQIFRDYVDTALSSGAVPATTTVAGLVELATQSEYDAGTATGGTGASLAATPAITRGKKYNDYAADSVGTDSYVITISPAITAYAAGQVFTFKAGTANTGAATLNVSGLGAKTIKKDVSSDLVTGDILVNQIIIVVYDGTNMQLQSMSSGLINPTSLSAATNAKTGIATRDLSATSAAVTYAHGLGRIPNIVELSAINAGSITCLWASNGAYDGTNNRCIWTGFASNGANDSSAGSSTTYAIALSTQGNGGAAANPDVSGQTGIVTVDATNITITWQKNGSPTSTQNFLWKVS